MKNKKKLVILVLAVVLVFAIVGTTLAWLTSENQLTNNFTVGTFTEPTTEPGHPENDIDTTDGTLDGNLYEKSWNNNNANQDHKLLPGKTFDKDPYVGIGPGSEDGVVYLYVENNLSNKVQFAINTTDWEAVSGYTTAGSESTQQAPTYTSGLFKYTAVLTGSANADSWTSTPLFSTVYVADDADDTDFDPGAGNQPSITVKSFIHQANDASGQPILSSTIEAAALDAFELD